MWKDPFERCSSARTLRAVLVGMLRDRRVSTSWGLGILATQRRAGMSRSTSAAEEAGHGGDGRLRLCPDCGELFATAGRDGLIHHILTSHYGSWLADRILKELVGMELPESSRG